MANHFIFEVLIIEDRFEEMRFEERSTTKTQEKIISFLKKKSIIYYSSTYNTV